MSNRSAVFGGAGFIGTNLVYQLIEDGQQVFNFDNLSGLGNLLNIAAGSTHDINKKSE